MAAVRMTTTRGKTFDWDSGRAKHGQSWDIANKHVKIIEKIRPPSPLRPKDPVPTAQDLKKTEESKMRCFNGPQMIELLRSAHKENSSSSLRSTSKHILSGVESSGATEQEASMPHASMHSDAAKQRKKEILELQRREDDDARMQGLRKNLKNMAERKEQRFQEAYAMLKAERENFIQKKADDLPDMGIDQYLQTKKEAALQKKKALHTEWSECVFKNIQDQLIDRVDTMDEKEIQARRRKLFQDYIDAAKAKGGGLFLDIVIENEYNPFTWKEHTLKYRAKPAVVSNGPGFTDRFGNPVFDPVKRDLEKLKSEAKQAHMVGGGTGAFFHGDEKMGRDTLGHEHWSKIEATPFFDRAAVVMDKIAAGNGPKVREAQKTNVVSSAPSPPLCTILL
jgi:hypothetical protein